jgi:hypothetical protein
MSEADLFPEKKLLLGGLAGLAAAIIGDYLRGCNRHDQISNRAKRALSDAICDSSSIAFSDSRTLHFCFGVEFCKKLTRDIGKFARPRNTHYHPREVR